MGGITPTAQVLADGAGGLGKTGFYGVVAGVLDCPFTVAELPPLYLIGPCQGRFRSPSSKWLEDGGNPLVGMVLGAARQSRSHLPRELDSW